MPAPMENKTLKELRALAKARGLKGYSKLSKNELLERLAATPSAATAEDASEREPSPIPSAAAPAIPPEPAPDAVHATPVAPTAAKTPADATDDERIERAKYAMRPNGAPIAHVEADLNEDIDRLPALREPAVRLLPQKPGILYAYWTLAPDAFDAAADYKLRLARDEHDSPLHEVPVNAPRGGWYFHVPEEASGAPFLAHIGYYRDGRFVAAAGRSAARLPSLHASARTDERWWIDEADFRRLYLRAGGEVTPARRYRWRASIGSPAGAPPTPEERLAWPGGVSSRASGSA
jgi:hypothetical protein